MAGSCSHSFPADLKADLEEIVRSFGINLQKLGEIDHRLALSYAGCINELVSKQGIKKSDIRAIGCHGQTIFHSPGSRYPFTMQIGDGNLIAARTGITTITDFRRMDMAFGGGGAPLAPAFHQYFLNNKDEKRGILNLGGIANLTVLSQNDNDVLGFDTGPANCLMDAWIRENKGQNFDYNGEWAASGSVMSGLLNSMISDNYFRMPPPKSTGRELFNLKWLGKHLELFPGCRAEDVQATLLELTAFSVAEAVKNYAREIAALYVCGGGAFNKFLLQRMSSLLSGIKIGTTDELGVPVQWVEAVAFAWLAMRRITRQSGNLPSVTGASRNVMLGAVYEVSEG